MHKINSIYIGVIGGGNCAEEVYKLAEEVGERIAKAGAILVCGGLGGVMEAAARGAKKQKGITIGILPGVDKNQANPFIDFPIATGLSEVRNILVVRNSDALIALPGEFGTLTEIAFALRSDKPVIGISTWDISEKIIKTKNPDEAVETAMKLVKSIQRIK
jgi:uncharacterized protein (TIGR00725 family)